MRKLLSALGVVAIMASCNSNPNKNGTAALQTPVPTLDTAGLAQYQAWKAQNELMRMQQQQQYMQYQQMQNAGMYGYAEPAPAPRRSYASSRGTSARRSSGGGTYASSSSQTARKRGWSKAAKGAAIGGAGGAVLGAVINKRNRVAGGVIGGIIGAGVGYGIGRSQDKKDGRY